MEARTVQRAPRCIQTPTLGLICPHVLVDPTGRACVGRVVEWQASGYVVDSPGCLYVCVHNLDRQTYASVSCVCVCTRVYAASPPPLLTWCGLQLMRIEEELGGSAVYAGEKFRKPI